jgi:hypothetical protein
MPTPPSTPLALTILGSEAFGAGMVPPSGTYIPTAATYYSVKIGGELDFGGVTLNAGAKVNVFPEALNLP